MATKPRRDYLPCFPSKDGFEAWLRFARLSGPLAPLSPCSDCTPEYAAQMRDEGRCLHAEVTFVDLKKVLKDGTIEHEQVGIHCVTPMLKRFITLCDPE